MNARSEEEENNKFLQDLKEVFRTIDKDNNGYINLKELEIAMRAFGFELNEIEIIELMKEYDKDGNDNLDLVEFIDLMNKKREEQKDEQDIIETFEALDINDDGFLSKKKLKLLFENIALDIDEEMIEEFIQYADKDRDNRINLGEFMSFMKEKS